MRRERSGGSERSGGDERSDAESRLGIRGTATGQEIVTLVTIQLKSKIVTWCGTPNVSYAVTSSQQLTWSHPLVTQMIGTDLSHTR